MTIRKVRTSFGLLAIVAVSALVAVLASCSKSGTERDAVPTGAAEYPIVDPGFLAALEWRSIGPFRGGRSPAVAGDAGDPQVFYMGTSHGGVWKTTDAGGHWRNVSDRFFNFAPIGAIDVSLSDPKVVYVGTGEALAYQHTTAGDGVWKSTNGGETWTHLGLEKTLHIAKIRIHPTNPDLVYVAAKGDIYGTNPERGVYRTKDGGKTWEKVLYRSDQAGATDISMDTTNAKVLFATLTQYVRLPWDEVSGGPDSGLYRTTDGGDTWTEITRSPGLPQGVVGKMSVAISPPRPSRVYALIEADDGGVYRSDDGGASWKIVSDNRDLRRFPMMFFQITADPQDPDTAYVQSLTFYKSTDGGVTFRPMPMRHSDHHALWIDPKNPKRMIDASDGGATVTMDGGLSWSTVDNQPTSDLFSLAVDDQDPYWLYAAQNDNSHIALPSRTDSGAIAWPDAVDIRGGEGGQTAVKPDGSVVYACDRTAMVRFDRRTGETADISVWPENEFGAAVKDVKYRFYYSFPVLLSPHDPNVLYTAAQYVFRTTNEGNSWEQISPDLTRNRQDKMQTVIGRPLTTIESSLYYVSLIRTIAESPLAKGELWVGTDDSTVQMSRDSGKTWENISAPDLPEWTAVTAIDVSRNARGTAYLAAERHRASDRSPYLYKTTDYGKTWEKITNGIPDNVFAYVIREDPVRPGLLFAGTETGAYVSFNAGRSWQSLRRNMPPAAVNYMLVKNDDLVVASHGRGFWILDNISALRQITPEVTAAPVHLFEVAPAVRRTGGRGMRRTGSFSGLQYTGGSGMSVAYQDLPGPDGEVRPTFLDAGQNPPNGVMVEYFVKQPVAGEAVLVIVDAQGQEIRRYSSQAKGRETLRVQVGMNRFIWDMRYPGATVANTGVELSTIESPSPAPPIAPPGRYTVRLRIGEKFYERPFEIRRDPTHSATDADLQAGFALVVQVRDKLSEVNNALNRLQDAERQLKEIEQRGGSNASAAVAVQGKLQAVKGQLTRIPGRNPLFLPPKALNNKLGAFSGKVGGRDARPTQQMYEVFEYLSARVAEEMRHVEAVMAEVQKLR